MKPSRSWPSVEPTALLRLAHAEAGVRSVLGRGGGGEAGSVKQKTAARKYSPATTRMTASGPGDVDDQRPEQREPERERRVERQREDAVRREQLAARHEHRDHRQLGRREEHA